MKPIIITLALVSAFFLSFAQLEGTYTVNQQLPSKKSNFNTLSEALNALRFDGVKGDVVIEITDGIYYEPIVLEEIGVDVNSNITITSSNNGKVKFVSDGIALLINNSENITISNLIFESQSTQISNAAILSNSNNIQVSNNEFLSEFTSNKDKSLISITGTSNNNLISNNLIKGSSGIEISRLSNENVLRNNNIYFTNIGISINSSLNNEIVSNKIKGTSDAANTAIEIDGYIGKTNILSNSISNTNNGIYQLMTYRPVENKFNGSILNNVIFANLNALTLNNNIKNLQIAYNSFNVEEGMVVTIEDLAGNSVSDIDLLANNIINFNSEFIVSIEDKNIMNRVDYNNLYSKTNRLNMMVGATKINEINSWRKEMTAFNAISADPMYVEVGQSNNYILAENSPCIDAGPEASSIGVYTDFDGDERNNKTEIGADEFNKTAYNAMMQKIQFALNK